MIEKYFIKIGDYLFNINEIIRITDVRKDREVSYDYIVEIKNGNRYYIQGNLEEI